MLNSPYFPLIPAKAGIQISKSSLRKVRDIWFPAKFILTKVGAGMSGMLVVACSPQTTEGIETTGKVVVAQTPTPPKSRTVDDIDFAAYSKDLAKFVGLAEGQSRGEAIDNVRLYFAPEDGAAIIQTSQSSFDLPDGAVLLFSAAGLPDDSVKAEEIYLILSGEKGAQTLAAYGSRIKCHRGENISDWQNTLCP